jgi:AbiV family abortive infection protein
VENVSQVLENAKDLLDSALILINNDKPHHGTHFAILSIEECAKCLILISEAPKKLKKSNKHYHKEELAYFFSYLAGKLNILYLIHRSMDDGILRKNVIVINDIKELCGLNGINNLKEIFNQYLEYSANDIKSEYKKSELRKKLLYADLKDGTIEKPFNNVNLEQTDQIISEAKFAIGILELIISKDFELKTLLKIYPTYFKNPEDGYADFLNRYNIQNVKQR